MTDLGKKYPSMIPVGFKKSEGTLAASSLTFGGIVPRVEMTITGGRVTKVIGGGKYGDTLRRSFEEFKHLHGHYHDSNHRGERHWRVVSGSATGLNMSVIGIISVFAPPVGNWLAKVGSGLPFLFWASLAFLGCVAYLFLRQRVLGSTSS